MYNKCRWICIGRIPSTSSWWCDALFLCSTTTSTRRKGLFLYLILMEAKMILLNHKLEATPTAPMSSPKARLANAMYPKYTM